MNVEVAPEAKPLQADLSVDTVVVGSGIAGLSTAYELVGRDRRWPCSIAARSARV